MTVNYMRNLKQSMNNSTENYENGYRHCSEEIKKLIHSLPNIYPEQRQHLVHRCQQMWTHRRSIHHHHHHPYQQRSIKQKCLQIIINDSCSSSSLSSNSLSPSSSSKLWKPYM